MAFKIGKDQKAYSIKKDLPVFSAQNSRISILPVKNKLNILQNTVIKPANSSNNTKNLKPFVRLEKSIQLENMLKKQKENNKSHIDPCKDIVFKAFDEGKISETKREKKCVHGALSLIPSLCHCEINSLFNDSEVALKKNRRKNQRGRLKQTNGATSKSFKFSSQLFDELDSRKENKANSSKTKGSKQNISRGTNGTKKCSIRRHSSYENSSNKYPNRSKSSDTRHSECFEKQSNKATNRCSVEEYVEPDIDNSNSFIDVTDQNLTNYTSPITIDEKSFSDWESRYLRNDQNPETRCLTNGNNPSPSRKFPSRFPPNIKTVKKALKNQKKKVKKLDSYKLRNRRAMRSSKGYLLKHSLSSVKLLKLKRKRENRLRYAAKKSAKKTHKKELNGKNDDQSDVTNGKSVVVQEKLFSNFEQAHLSEEDIEVSE